MPRRVRSGPHRDGPAVPKHPRANCACPNRGAGAARGPFLVRGLNTQGAGDPMPVTRDSPSTQGDVPGPDPARAPPNKAIAPAGLACRGQPAGASLSPPRTTNTLRSPGKAVLAWLSMPVSTLGLIP